MNFLQNLTSLSFILPSVICLCCYSQRYLITFKFADKALILTKQTLIKLYWLRCVTVILLILIGFSAMAQTVRFVKSQAAGTGDGSSWANASSDLSAILATSAAGNEIWVAAGNFIPTLDPYGNASPLDPRNKTFYVKDGVKLYGGFAGTETNLSQRTFAVLTANTTVLSGEIGLANSNLDNCYHVIVGSATPDTGIGITIDGFQITSGTGGSPVNIIINSNAVELNCGSGIYVCYGSNIIRNNVFYNNSTIYGAIYTLNGVNNISNNTFLSNSTNFGGGIYTDKGINKINNNSFITNGATKGGGIYTNFSTNTVSNNIFSKNGAGFGGAVYSNYSTNSLDNNTFFANHAEVIGGGIYNWDSYNTISNNIFWENRTQISIQGVDIYQNSNGNICKNNLLQLDASNYSTLGSGHYDIGVGASGNIFNIEPKFADTKDIDGLDGIHRTRDDGLCLRQTSQMIDAGNNQLIGAGVLSDITGAARIQNGTVNIGAYEILSHSLPIRYVKINSSGLGDGSSWANASNDLQVMINASPLEIWISSGIFKPTQGPLENLNPADPRDKTFYINKNIKLYGGFAGNETALDQRTAATINANTTILSGDIGITNSNNDNCYHVILVSEETSTQEQHEFTINGVSVEGGNANGVGVIWVGTKAISRNIGAGICASSNGDNNTKSYILNNTFSSNTASSYGGGIYLEKSRYSIISDNRFANNSAEGGGGFCLAGYANTINNNVFTANIASSIGGGVLMQGSNYNLNNNTFLGNAAWTGGGIYCSGGSTGQIVQNTFMSNQAIQGNGGGIFSVGTAFVCNNVFSANSATKGGGLCSYYGKTTIDHNTFSANTASNNGGAIAMERDTNTISNTLFWGNKKNGSSLVQGSDIYQNNSNNTFVNNFLQLANNNYTNIGTGAYDLGINATHNKFNVDPLFINATDPDGADNIHRTIDDGLNLQSISLAIDSGDNKSIGIPFTNDIRGLARTQNTVTDIGAYEVVGAILPIRYVKAQVSGTGDGSSWANASDDLQAMCAASAQEVWVSSGLFKPTRDTYGSTIPSDPRNKTFYVKSGLKIYGGFVGTEIALSERTIQTIASNTTILSGDIGVPRDSNDNCYHVVVPSSITQSGISTTIDGFTITGGNANGNASIVINTSGDLVYQGAGGGIYAYKGKNIFRNNVIEKNRAKFHGGGIYTDRGTNTIIANTISANDIDSIVDGYAHDGAGISTFLSANNIISNIIIGNRNKGGNSAGISTFGSKDSISNNIITYNIGSGIFAYRSNTMLNHNTFSNNFAPFGGGFYLSSGNALVMNNNLSNNISSSHGGGGVLNSVTCSVSNNIFLNNSATEQGGGLFLAGSGIITNSIFSGNTAKYGGGISGYSGNNTLSNNTIVANLATFAGGGIYTTNNSTNTISNTIFWGNKRDNSTNVQGADYFRSNGANNFKNNLLQLPSSNYTTTGNGNYDLGTAEGNLFNLQPQFVNENDIDGIDNLYRTEDDGLRLQNGSPLINSGNNSLIPKGIFTDIIGAFRIQGATVDIGAYEQVRTNWIKPILDSNELEIQIYPNPALTEAHLSIATARPTSIRYTIFDMVGRVLAVQNITVNGPINIHDLDITLFQQGLYEIRFENFNQQVLATRRFVKIN